MLDLPSINCVFWFWKWIAGLHWSVLMGVGLDVGVDNWSGSTFDTDPSYLWIRKGIGSNQAGTSNIRFRASWSQETCTNFQPSVRRMDRGVADVHRIGCVLFHV